MGLLHVEERAPLVESERQRAVRVLPEQELLVTGGLGLLSSDRQTVTGATNATSEPMNVRAPMRVRCFVNPS